MAPLPLGFFPVGRVGARAALALELYGGVRLSWRGSGRMLVNLIGWWICLACPFAFFLLLLAVDSVEELLQLVLPAKLCIWKLLMLECLSAFLWAAVSY